ncbi:MAG: hypothetical protein ABJA78_13010 [Ferruginibacter sp.]
MKKNYTLMVFAAIIFFASCTKVSTPTPANTQNVVTTNPSDHRTGTDRVGDDSTSCAPQVQSLIAGQHIEAGSVTVSNDNDFIYVTYNTANGYTLTQTHLYVGDCAMIPVTGSGNPVPGQFPYASAHNHSTSYTYSIPISAIGLGNCGCIAAHAAVEKLNDAGQVIDSQTAWGNGTRITPKGNWAMKFTYCTCTTQP